MQLTSIQAALLLAVLPKIGPSTAKKLIDFSGSPEAVFLKKSSELLTINNVGQSHLEGFTNKKQHTDAVLKEEKFIQENKLKAIYYGEENYPLSLQYVADPPTVFFQKGEVNWTNKKIISIVGTRNPSSHALSFCKKLIEEIAPYHPIIVSGFAQGVDICAHLTALKMGLETVAVLGHGFTKWYPKSNAQFVSKILDNGAFLSEFWHSSHFDPKNFIRRNRIVAGLAHATVVIESEKKGGSLVTANLALAYGREVFAVPGRVTDKKSEGCLNLIKYDRARIITSGEDLVKWLEWEEKPMGNPQIQKQLFQSFSKEEQVLYSILETPHSLDDLSFKSKLSISQVASLLLQLEIKSAVRPLAGKKFERF